MDAIFPDHLPKASRSIMDAMADQPGRERRRKMAADEIG
jgi:hypothetical protein